MKNQPDAILQWHLNPDHCGLGKHCEVEMFSWKSRYFIEWLWLVYKVLATQNDFGFIIAYEWFSMCLNTLDILFDFVHPQDWTWSLGWRVRRSSPWATSSLTRWNINKSLFVYHKLNKYDNPVISSLASRPILNPWSQERERTSVDSTGGVSTLTITLVTEEDMGVYTCR